VAPISNEEIGQNRSRVLLELRHHPSAFLGGLIVVVVVLLALFAPHMTSHDPLRTNVTQRLLSPSAEHWLGTDDYGRDLFARIALGARVSLRVGAAVAVLTSVGGVIIGLAAGYYTRIDAPVMRIMDVMMAFPALLLALAIVAALGPHELNTILALSLVYLPRTARIVRGSVLSIKRSTFVTAARSLGSGDWRIISRHIFPNCAAPLLVQATFVFAMAILGEAALSFLGAGPPPPTPTWGNMISDARLFLRQAPWFSIFPGAAIFFTVIGISLLGDGLRDVLDPKVDSHVDSDSDEPESPPKRKPQLATDDGDVDD